MKQILLLAFAVMALAAPVNAQDNGQSNNQTISQNGRYTLVVVDDGFIRLDTQSGEISRCTGDPDKLTCRLAADERLAYIGEIERLESRIDDLEERTARLESTGTATDRAPAMSRNQDFGLPSDEEIDHALGVTDKIFRRFFGMVRDLRRDMEQDRL
ncbi:MAG TPA: hypothetical protein VKN63_09645 [Afifellaceae bacterium]|nr:hypothetical protein [Afifellaceae bacterium]